MKRNFDLQTPPGEFPNENMRVLLPQQTDLQEIISFTVEKTLHELGFKGGFQQKIRRADIVKMIGRRRFDQAVMNGELRVIKNGHGRTSAVWVEPSEWERFSKKNYL